VHNGVLARHGVNSEQALEDSLEAQRAHLAQATQERVQELHRSDRRASVLVVLALFNAFSAALGAISLFDAYRAKHRQSGT